MKRVLADGTVRTYSYVRKPPKRKGVAYSSNALARVIDQWQRSPKWDALSPRTIRVYKHGLRFLDDHRADPITTVARADLLALRDTIARARGSATANNFITTVSALMNFALDRGIIQIHPLIKPGHLAVGEWRRWPDEAVTYALENFPAHLRRAVILALYTGQRSGDCCRMRWDDFDGEGISCTQEKTGKHLWIACHEELKAELAQWPKDAVTILTNSLGRPWRLGAFQVSLHREMRQHVELTGLVFHGLRKAAAARLAEAGCTTPEIAAITGQSLKVLEHYTKEADQRIRATAAIIKLQNAKRRNRG